MAAEIFITAPLVQQAQEKPKQQNIELLRILSALGIVWYHSGAVGGQIAYAGLVVFAIISMYLAGKSRNPQAGTPHARVVRLLRPWAIWFFIYGLINVMGHRLPIHSEHGMIGGILCGPSLHLWYMPFIFFCLMIFDAVRPRLSERALGWGSAVLAIGALASVDWWRPLSLSLPLPAPQYAHAMAGVFIGVFFAYYGALRRVAHLLLAVMLAFALLAAPWRDVGVTYLLALVASFAMIFLVPRRFPYFDVVAVSRCTPGIYFIHILWLNLLGKFAIDGPWLPICAFLGSLLMVMAGRKLFPAQAHYWS